MIQNRYLGNLARPCQMFTGSANQRDTTAGRVHRSAFLTSRLEIPGWVPIDGGIGRTLCIASDRDFKVLKNAVEYHVRRNGVLSDSLFRSRPLADTRT